MIIWLFDFYNHTVLIHIYIYIYTRSFENVYNYCYYRAETADGVHFLYRSPDGIYTFFSLLPRAEWIGGGGGATTLPFESADTVRDAHELNSRFAPDVPSTRVRATIDTEYLPTIAGYYLRDRLSYRCKYCLHIRIRRVFIRRRFFFFRKFQVDKFENLEKIQKPTKKKKSKI